MIDIHVYDQYENARHQFLCVHDIDLQRWSLNKARELNLNDFPACKMWLTWFKYRHRICSRKITKLVIKKDIENKEDINKAAKNFVLETNLFIKKTNRNQVLNSDQMGIELEPYGNRTLTCCGEKSTCWSV
jgi:hypothetical protein